MFDCRNFTLLPTRQPSLPLKSQHNNEVIGCPPLPCTVKPWSYDYTSLTPSNISFYLDPFTHCPKNLIAISVVTYSIPFQYLNNPVVILHLLNYKQEIDKVTFCHTYLSLLKWFSILPLTNECHLPKLNHDFHYFSTTSILKSYMLI